MTRWPDDVSPWASQVCELNSSFIVCCEPTARGGARDLCLLSLKIVPLAYGAARFSVTSTHKVVLNAALLLNDNVDKFEQFFRIIRSRK